MKSKTETQYVPPSFLKTRWERPPPPASPPSSLRPSSGKWRPATASTSAPSVSAASRAVHDLPGIWQYDQRASSPCAISTANRVEQGKALINDVLRQENRQGLRRRQRLPPLSRTSGQQGHRRRRHLHARPPARDHSPCDAVRASKDVYLQKPASLTIAEGRYLADTVKASGPHPADRLAAALLEAVPPRLRTGAQRPHRRDQARRDRSARRSLWTRAPPMPVPANSELRRLAGIDAGGLLHRDARASAERVRPARLAALRAVRRRHDHRLGRAPRRHRALGHEHRTHRPRRDLGHGGVPHERALERARASS